MTTRSTRTPFATPDSGGPVPARPEPRFRRLLRAAALALAVATVPGIQPAVAQEPGPPTDATSLRVFLDCSGGRGWAPHCDGDLYRQEITFVDWVREPQDAHVHVILTTQGAGGGGSRYTLDFLGRGSLEGMGDEYTYTSSVTDVESETVEGLLRTMRLGLVRFALAAGYGDRLAVELRAPAEGEEPGEEGGPVSPEEDPWNFWVFDIDADVSYESEDLQESQEYGFGVSANRTTEAWKFNVRANGSFERETFELPEEDRVVHNDQDRWNVSAFAVKSLGEHWGVGAELAADNSTRLNRDLLVGFSSGIEYDYFPYAQSNRRVLLARYIVSVENVQYQDTTVFDLLEETVYRHELGLDYEAREPWGNANIGAGISQYLDRTDAWSFDVRGFVRYRLFRGFSINVNGEYREVHDQIYLSKEELSDEDVLLGRRSLPTESQIEFRVGLSYSFGSIFNNAVNERFSRGLRGGGGR